MGAVNLQEILYKARKYSEFYLTKLKDTKELLNPDYQTGIYTYEAVESLKSKKIEELEILELEKYWFWPFLFLIDKEEFKQICSWICLGLFEGEEEKHWLYFCDQNLLKEVLFCFSLIGNPLYEEIMNQHLILSYPLLKKIQKIKKDNVGYPLLIPLKSLNADEVTGLAPCYFISYSNNIKFSKIEMIISPDTSSYYHKFVTHNSYDKYFSTQEGNTFTFNIKFIPLSQKCEKINLSIEPRKLYNYLMWMSLSARNEGRLILTVPGWRIPYDIKSSVAVICLNNYDTKLIQKIISAVQIINSYFPYQAVAFYHKKVQYYALCSAIAAIMSRNMSHNIGSHVLAYLRMEKLFELAVKFVNKDDGESINKIKDLINKIEQYGNTVQSFCNKLRNANTNGVKEELDKIKEQMHSHKEEIQKIINSLTGSELRWGLMEWIEDTKIFFEYLQHRMDFLAQISTEWPEWSFSAYLMKDIMRYFLSQRHLLDGIAKSEGLRGFYYDWEKPYKQYLEVKQKSDQGKSEEYGRIKFHVVNLACFDTDNKETVKKIWYRNVDNNKINEKCRIKKRLEQIKTEFNNEKKKRILLYTKEDSEVNIEEGDVQLAIPGGIIGYHAFYVILENIIRNSAKHSYNKNKIEDLEIMIEFTDDPFKHDEFWLFRIYDNASCASKDNNAKVKGKRFRIFSEDIPDNNDLVAFMNECLRHSIIKETGELDKKHWGMAEMKIAAGYLQGRDISRIGAKGNDITGSENNQDADEEDFIIRAVESPVGTLGFEFKVRKPKEVGIVCYKGEEA